jgi:aryl-alcohol dehydrogenase-like predicted oxidoreductase
VMMRPVWPGCVASNDMTTLNYLRENQITHLSWSSQARGYFLPEELRSRLPLDTAPETCFGGEDNSERRRRSEELALKYKVSAHNIATAWVLAQGFPSIALVGPRSPGEIVSTLPGLGVSLTQDEVKWLNLEKS